MPRPFELGATNLKSSGGWGGAAAPPHDDRGMTGGVRIELGAKKVAGDDSTK